MLFVYGHWLQLGMNCRGVELSASFDDLGHNARRKGHRPALGRTLIVIGYLLQVVECLIHSPFQPCCSFDPDFTRRHLVVSGCVLFSFLFCSHVFSVQVLCFFCSTRILCTVSIPGLGARSQPLHHAPRIKPNLFGCRRLDDVSPRSPLLQEINGRACVWRQNRCKLF